MTDQKQGQQQVCRRQSASHWPKVTRKRHSLSLLLMVVLLASSVCILTILYQVQAASTTTSQPMGAERQPKITAHLADVEPEVATETPVIGILTEVLRDYKRFTHTRQLHIAGSYVKWIEAAGAQVMPILLNQDEHYYERMFNQTNGLLLPGGDNLLDPAKRTPMMVAANKLYRLAVEANDRGDFYPIWGTCLGLELLSVLSAQRNVLDSCEAHDIALKMDFVGRGRLFAPSTYSGLTHLSADYAQVMVDLLAKTPISYNYHGKCLTDEGLARAKLADFYRPLAYSVDKNNLKFIAIMEAVRYPFYGVIFHPEKAPFEFVTKSSQMHIPHSREAVAVSRYFADFFVSQAQLNGHQHPRDPNPELIYNFNPTYTAPMRDMYEQRYLFPYGNGSPSTSAEEFIDDHVVESDEEVSEQVSEQGKDESNRPEMPSAQTAMFKLEPVGQRKHKFNNNNNMNEGYDGQLVKNIDLKLSGDDDNNLYLLLQSDED